MLYLWETSVPWMRGVKFGGYEAMLDVCGQKEVGWGPWVDGTGLMFVCENYIDKFGGTGL